MVNLEPLPCHLPGPSVSSSGKWGQKQHRPPFDLFYSVFCFVFLHVDVNINVKALYLGVYCHLFFGLRDLMKGSRLLSPERKGNCVYRCLPEDKRDTEESLRV